MEEPGYAITETVSRDARATLYRAVRRADRHPVLLKVLGAGAPWDEVERLRKELEIAGTIRRPHIVRPLAVDTYEGNPVLVSEDVSGAPLSSMLGKPMAVSRFLELAVNIAGALEQVHQAGIVHKDVTPNNVFVRSKTAEASLSEFGFASRNPSQYQAGQAPELIEGTLPYMSPEQTGRINRQVDERSDLYSLGITFFLMLTGRLPFAARDPLEWVHAHVARPVPAPEAFVSGIPPVVSRIVRRLLEKMPENRYQTARGLRHDLTRASRALKDTGRIPSFALGKRDIVDRFELPERLYGRRAELQRLLGLLNRTAASGRPALGLVVGPSGVGKSALVHELLRSVESTRGFFLVGKFEQRQNDIPYSTLARAFRVALRNLLSGSEERLAKWREHLKGALGANAGLVAEIVPEVELILGASPAVTPLTPIEAEQRFKRVFQAFITAFASAGRPLVLFLDDLQWADVASLDLSSFLLTSADTRHVLVLGAYRDNEVPASHRLCGVVQEVREASVHVEEIGVGPLSVEEVLELTGDALRRPCGDLRPLASLVYEKTGGNPLFVTQFLVELVREGLLRFDGRTWCWDLQRIRDKGYSDNVVDFMVGRVAGLPEAARSVVELAACAGNVVEAKTLAALCELDEASLERDLRPALEQRLLVPLDGGYRFAHDRVRQAAYSLVPDEQRPIVHARIGRLLLRTTPDLEAGERIFEIANQLNRGRSRIEAVERAPFAEIHLRAARKAIAAVAYSTARSYAESGLALLPEDAWESLYELCFALHLEAARCEVLVGAEGEAHRRIRLLHAEAVRPEDRAQVAAVEVTLLTLRGQLDRALDVARSALGMHGVELTSHPSWADVVRAREELQRALGDRPIEDLIDLPARATAEVEALLGLIIAVMPVALFTDENLLASFALTALELSIQHGLTDATASACVILGMVMAHRFGEYDEAAAFARLGKALVDRRGLSAYRAKVYLDFALVSQWMTPLHGNRDVLRSAFQSALETGSSSIACYVLNNTISLLLALGAPLDEVRRECERALEFARRARYPLVEAIVTSQLRLVLDLQGCTAHFSTFDDADFREDAFVAELEGGGAPNAIAICWHFVRKLQARYFSGDYEEAWQASLRAKRLAWTSRAFLETTELHLFSALTAAALHDRAPEEERTELSRILREERDRFAEWSRECPINFLPKLEIVEGELRRVEGDAVAAVRHYEAAIRAANEGGFPSIAALANEVSARCCDASGFSSAAELFFDEARRLYRAWGASGKVRQLERLVPVLQARHESAGAVRISSEQIDLVAVTKASQAVSLDLGWDGVTRRLLEVALQQGGATRGCLIFEKEAHLVVVAEARADEHGVTTRLVDSELITTANVVPVPVVRLVRWTRERVVLDDPAVEGPFANDPYLRGRRPCSVLCLPIIRRTEVIGVLYLENELVAGVFTPERMLALELIAGQAAIALANARLFAQLERENAQRARAEAFLEQSRGKLQQIIDNTTALIWVKAADGHVVLTNRSFEELFHVGRKQVQGMTDRDLSSGTAAESQRAHDLIPLRENRAIEIEERIELDDGEHTFLSLKFPLRDAEGRPYEVCSISTDITARKRFEDQLRRSVSLLSATLDSTGDAIMVVDNAGRLVQFNRRYVDMWGDPARRCAAEGGALPPLELSKVRQSAADPRAFERELERLRRDPGASSSGLIELDDGRIIETDSQPQRTEGRIVGRVWSFRDVTNRVSAERERDRLLVQEKKARVAAEEAVRVRDEFLSVASHELRTPLTSLQLVIQVITRTLGEDLPPAIERNFALCRRQLRRMSTLVGLLLDVSRIQAGRLEVEPRRVDLSQLVQDTAEQLVEDAALAGSPLSVRADEPVVGDWDPMRIEQLLVNLLTNAIKFGEGKPIEVVVESATVEGAPRARLLVSDRGMGIPDEVRSVVFDRFSRAVSARHYGGLGLGLYIVRTIAEAHGGRVFVVSRVGRGSTFTVELPLERPAEREVT